MLHLEQVSKSFVSATGRREEILDRVSLTFDSGTMAAVMGRSGSGKSTLLSLMALFDQADAGSIWLEGRNVTDVADDAASRLRGQLYGFVFQRFFLVAHLTAAENVAAGLVHSDISWRERRRRVDDALAAVDLSDRKEHRPARLSGGEQQRVAIARALARRPRIILADEPTGALDEQTAESVMELLLLRARDEGATIIIATHDQLVAEMMDEVYLLERGRLLLRSDEP